MKAIFDKNCKCVGWYNENDGMVYDNEMRWIGFISKNYFFADTTEWLGGLQMGLLWIKMENQLHGSMDAAQ